MGLQPIVMIRLMRNWKSSSSPNGPECSTPSRLRGNSRRSVITLLAELLRRLQLESWACLRFHPLDRRRANGHPNHLQALPKWARRIANRLYTRRSFPSRHATAPNISSLGNSQPPWACPVFAGDCTKPYPVRPAMRIHAMLLLREQTEIIRDVRARFAAGRCVLNWKKAAQEFSRRTP